MNSIQLLPRILGEARLELPRLAHSIAPKVLRPSELRSGLGFNLIERTSHKIGTNGRIALRLVLNRGEWAKSRAAGSLTVRRKPFRLKMLSTIVAHARRVS